MKEKIMIVDDNANICEILQVNIEKEGYSTILVNDGNAAVERFEKETPALILLDVMLPGLDGWQVLRKIRQTSDVPVIMISAKTETFDKVLSLELGCDDYITKPFDPKEVIARVKAVLRRSSSQTVENVQEVRYDKLVVNLTNYELRVDNQLIDTPPKELELLYFLASNPNKVFSRNELLDKIWGYDYYGGSRSVDVHIKRIRSKISNVSTKWELKTIWSVGYKFETKESD